MITGKSKLALSDGRDLKYDFIFYGLCFLSLGLITSPTLVSVYQILIFIPTIILFAKGARVKLSVSSWMLLGLTTWGLISIGVNFETIIKPSKSLQELKYFVAGILCIVPLNYFFQKASTKHKKIIFNILHVTIILAFIVGIFRSWLQFDLVKMQSGTFHIRSGGFVHYMRYGYSSAFLAIFYTGIYFNREKLVEYITPKLFYSAWILTFLAVATSQTRGALLGLLIGLPILLWKYKKTWAKAFAIFTGLFLTSVLTLSLTGAVEFRFLNIKDASNNTRMSQFYSAYKSIQERPLFGLGPDQFSYNVKRIKEKYDIWEKHYHSHSHNIILEHAANYGIVGAIIFLGFLFSWMFEMLRRGDDIGQVVLAYLCAFFVSGQVELLFDVINSHIIFFIYSFSHIGNFYTNTGDSIH